MDVGDAFEPIRRAHMYDWNNPVDAVPWSDVKPIFQDEGIEKVNFILTIRIIDTDDSPEYEYDRLLSQ